jgi:fructokinase
MLRIGIDLGGTKIEIIALDEDGRTLARRRVATPQGDYGATVAAVAGLVAAVEGELGRRGTVGVGTPGALAAQRADQECQFHLPDRQAPAERSAGGAGA